MRVELDENLGRSIAALFESAGHDVATVYGQGMASAKDEEVYSVCCGEGRVIVTLDRTSPIHSVTTRRALPASPSSGSPTSQDWMTCSELPRPSW